ncbi:MAG: DUF4846 domain-containing protein [Eubacterium sp.]
MRKRKWKTGGFQMQSDGTTLETRISVPEGYTRVEEENGSLGVFLRSYPLCPDGSEVLLYDGRPKSTKTPMLPCLTCL